MNTHSFLVRRDRLAETRWHPRPDLPLAAGQVRVGIDKFALTANNITYAAFGDAMHYWDFFPSGEEGWGIVPVWGFGQVQQSMHPGVAVGERLYGYWPMAERVVLDAARLGAGAFDDAAPHRAALPALYNRYLRCASDPLYAADDEDALALLRPLLMTAWLIDDFLADNAWFGAAGPGRRPVLLLSSASSKTAYATAQALQRREDVEVVGLTSEARVDFCRSLGCYHRVLHYGQLDQVPADAPCVYIDFAGDRTLRQRVHERFSALAYSCAVGATHLQQLGGGRDLPGPAPTLFFAPAQARKRQEAWGAEDFRARLRTAWQDFLARAQQPADPWLVVVPHHGPEAIAAAYRRVLAGDADPREGHMLYPR